MKKLSFILLSGLFIGLIGCTKEDIRPLQDDVDNLELRAGYQENTSNNDGSSSTDLKENKKQRSDGEIDPSITDPNRDEDDNKKIRVKTSK